MFHFLKTRSFTGGQVPWDTDVPGTIRIYNEKKEDLHEYLRANVDIMTKNIYSSKDCTYNKLKNIINNKDIAVVRGDKDSCVVVMDKQDYVDKLQRMIDDGIRDGIYEPTTDTILPDLKKFNNFLYRHFSKNHPELYKDMTAISSQPGQLYGTAKTHKFENLMEVSVETLKFRPIISQVGAQTYNAAKVIGDYLKPLIQDNQYIIDNTQDFAVLIRDEPSLDPSEEYVSYDVESLFTNVPVLDTIDFILEEIYDRKKLSPLCARKFLKKLLIEFVKTFLCLSISVSS